MKRGLRGLGIAIVWAFFASPFLVGSPRCMFAARLHLPCPGCGMTRAFHLLESGDVLGSLAMHPMTVPLIVSTVAFALATIVLTVRDGSPLALLESRAARASLFAMLAVQAATLLLWVLRWGGLFGGPVPV